MTERIFLSLLRIDSSKLVGAEDAKEVSKNTSGNDLGDIGNNSESIYRGRK